MNYKILRISPPKPTTLLVREINRKKLVNVRKNSIIVEPREDEEFAYRSFYLDPGFDWELGVDNGGVKILVPLKKEIAEK